MNPTMPNREFIQKTICADANDLALCAARRIAAIARSSIAARGRFTLVLAGGSTPEKTYRLLGDEHQETDWDWSSTWLFLGDERFVPAEDERSNLSMIQRALLSHISIPAPQVVPIPTTLPNAEAGALRYAEQISSIFGVNATANPPAFDLVLLGLGDDGHTASLFPGKPALSETKRWVVASPPGRLPPPVERVTLTFPILNRARNILFLVAGANKAEIVKQIFCDDPSVDECPAAGIRPLAGQQEWYLDHSAARLISKI
jgi:6-phosphogluconolactonase